MGERAAANSYYDVICGLEAFTGAGGAFPFWSSKE